MATDAVYQPRNPEQNPVYGIVAGHLETFLARQRERDRHVPGFVENASFASSSNAVYFAGASFAFIAMPAAWTASFPCRAKKERFAILVADAG